MPSILNACAAALAGLAGLAAAPAVTAQTMDREVAQVCKNVVGVAPGEKHFAACTQSLADSLRSLAQGRGLAIARRACLAQGLQPNTGALAECELTAPRAEVLPVGGLADATPIPGGGHPYFMISRDTAFQRMQLACARLGFDPAQGAFGGCVADLKSALARASEPSM